MQVNSIQRADLYYPEPSENKFQTNVISMNDFPSEEDMFVKTVEQPKEENPNGEKVGFFEGLKLIGKGFVNKAKNMITSVFKHPIKTIAAVGLTTLALSALPLIGITAATGAAVLALGFAAFAVTKTIVDVVETVKDNKEGRYNEVREDLEKIGGDGVDLALSLPFVPKAAKQVTRFAKYGTSTVGVNSELISNLKNAHSAKDVSLELAKAEAKINYEMIGNEMGLAVKPKMVFKKFETEPGQMVGGAYEPTTGELQINEGMLTGQNRALAKKFHFDTETIMRHELEHFRQFSDIARTEGIGIEGLEGTLTEYYNSMKGKVNLNDLEKQGLSRNTYENMTTGDKSVFNREFYQNIVDSQGKIPAGSKQAELSAEYAQGLLEKINPRPEHIAQFEQETKGITGLSAAVDPFARAQVMKAQMNLYKANILEKEAYAAQEVFQKAVTNHRPGAVVSSAEVLGSITDEKEKELKK